MSIRCLSIRIVNITILALGALFAGSAAAVNMSGSGNMTLSAGGAFLHSNHDRLQVYLIGPTYNDLNGPGSADDEPYKPFQLLSVCYRRDILPNVGNPASICRRNGTRKEWDIRDQRIVSVETPRLEAGRRYQVYVELTDVEGLHLTSYYGKIRIGDHTSPNIASSRTVTSVGLYSDGADVALAHIGGDPQRMDVVMMSYDDPARGNNFRYRVGWDIDSYGKARSWSGTHQVDGMGWAGEGAGVTISNLDNDPRPDMMLMKLDPGGDKKNFRYRIAWNLDAAGKPTRVGPTTLFGDQTLPSNAFYSGASAAFGQMDSDPRPDVILVGLSDTSKRFIYRIGYNFNSNGYASSWSDITIGHDIGYVPPSEGMGVDFTDLNGNSIPDLVLMAYEKNQGPLSIYNGFRYYVGWDFFEGEASYWTTDNLIPGVGEYAADAGLAIADIDNDGKQEFMLMGLENIRNSNNQFRYKVQEVESCRFCQ